MPPQVFPKRLSHEHTNLFCEYGRSSCRSQRDPEEPRAICREVLCSVLVSALLSFVSHLPRQVPPFPAGRRRGRSSVQDVLSPAADRRGTEERNPPPFLCTAPGGAGSVCDVQGCCRHSCGEHPSAPALFCDLHCSGLLLPHANQRILKGSSAARLTKKNNVPLALLMFLLNSFWCCWTN